MLHSMTGFARESAESPLGTLTWELRAVNHRYFDVQFRIPDELRPHEQALRQRIHATLKRGKIECSLNVRRAFDASRELALDDQLVAALAARLETLASTLREPGRVDPMDVLRWPGVIEAVEIEAEPLLDESSRLLDAAVHSLQTMRASEGDRIAQMLESRLSDVEHIASNVRARMPQVLEAARTRQRERIDKLDVTADPERLEVELALVAQKLDIDEELDRLDSHVHEIRAALGNDEPVGRRLDFLMQELNREANTLASKSADAETTKAAVELKVLIEQMREQIQNVE